MSRRRGAAELSNEGGDWKPGSGLLLHGLEQTATGNTETRLLASRDGTTFGAYSQSSVVMDYERAETTQNDDA